MGKYMIMSGGKSIKDDIYSDFWALDMCSYKWFNFQEISLPLYEHTMTACFDPDRKLDIII